MKYTLTFLVFLLMPLYSFSQGEVDTVQWYQLEKRDDLNYTKGSEVPYSGVAVTWHANGKKESERNLVKGQIEGIATHWFESGNKRTEGNFVNGKLEGIKTSWYENGNKKFEIIYVNGKKEGRSTEWLENGTEKKN
jgi:antitoxin component YwqK of YwqJK toxin-antitoxin module